MYSSGAQLNSAGAEGREPRLENECGRVTTLDKSLTNLAAGVCRSSLKNQKIFTGV